MTLKYDGTTDREGSHVTEVELSTENETLLIGLQRQSGATADDYFRTITNSINEIDTEISKKLATQ